MWTLQKTITISGAHQLKNLTGSPCQRLHGHNWRVTVWCKSSTLDEQGMVVDFSRIKAIVMELDHQDITPILRDQDPTAENIARWLLERIPFCFKVEIEETPGSVVVYEV